MTALAAQGPKAAGVRWALDGIVADAATARRLLDESIATAESFAERYRGRVGELDAGALAAALDELGGLTNALHRVGSYAGLLRSVDVNDVEARDLEAVVDQGMVRAGNALRFFELEWIAVDDARAEELLADERLAMNSHHLRSERRYRPHRLSEPEERMLAEREPVVQAWSNLFDQTVANVRTSFDDGEGARDHTVEELLSYVHRPDRALRLGALDALYGALEPQTPVLAQCYDAIVADRLVQDRLRAFPDPLAARHLGNELEPAAVDAMMAAIEERYDIAQRWFRRKAELLGLERLHLADQYAPLDAGRVVGYEESRALVRDAFGRFSPEIRDTCEAFFEERRVDAEPRQGKRGGAFCASVAQDSAPFVLLNYTDTLRDVMTMAHELGHGMHFAYSRRQTPLSFHAPLALCEVPSTFAELLVFDRMLEVEEDPATRGALVRGELESGFATVFRQTMMVRYEQDAYGARGEGQALTPERLSAFWLDRNQRYYGDSMELPEGYRLGWSYIPHFIHTRFYTYAYAFAHLASLVLYGLYRDEGAASFVPRYQRLLETGGASAPGDQLGAFGIDLVDVATWRRGLDEMERMLDAALAG